MFRYQRVRCGDVQLGVCSQVGFELVQRGAGVDAGDAGRISVQPTVPAAGRLAQTFRLLDDAEQRRVAQEHQLVADDGRSRRHPLVLQCHPRRHQRRLCLRLFGHLPLQVSTSISTNEQTNKFHLKDKNVDRF